MSKEILQKILAKAEADVYGDSIYPIRRNEQYKIRQLLRRDYADEMSDNDDDIGDAETHARDAFKGGADILYMYVSSNPIDISFYTGIGLVELHGDKAQ